METKYIIMTGAESPFVCKIDGYQHTAAHSQWMYTPYHNRAALFDSKADAHAVAKEMRLNTYSLLESYSRAASAKAST